MARQSTGHRYLHPSPSAFFSSPGSWPSALSGPQLFGDFRGSLFSPPARHVRECRNSEETHERKDKEPSGKRGEYPQSTFRRALRARSAEQFNGFFNGSKVGDQKLKPQARQARASCGTPEVCQRSSFSRPISVSRQRSLPHAGLSWTGVRSGCQ